MSNRMPKGLSTQGQKLWKSIVSSFSLEDDPDKSRILFDACKLADQIDKMEKAMAGEPLTVLGSARQRVIHPLVAEIRVSRALLAQLLARMNFEEAPGDV